MSDLCVVVPITVKNPTNTREHWGDRAKRVKKQRADVGMMLRLATYIDPRMLTRAFEPVRSLVVTLTRFGRAMDDDGNVAALKHVRDEVAAYCGVNDNDPRIVWKYAQAKGTACVRLEFEVVSDVEALEKDWLKRGMPLEYSK